MLQPGLDAPRQIGRGDADEGEPDQQEREVTGPDRRIPDWNVAAGAILTVADDDQHDSDQGDQGIEPLKGPLADPRDHLRPGAPRHAKAMVPEKKQKSK